MCRRTTLLVLGLACAALVACGGPATIASDKIEVSASDFAFTPTQWTIPAGQEITITFTNKGSVEHEWVLINKGEKATPPFNEDDEPKVFWEVEAEPGKTITETFKAPTEPGEYQVVCGTPTHLEQGMQANIVVR